MSAKNGSRGGEYISQQRTERTEGFDELGGTEEAQEPGEGQVVPIETHPRDEQAVCQHDEQQEGGGDCDRSLKEVVDFFFHAMILPFGMRRYNPAHE